MFNNIVNDENRLSLVEKASIISLIAIVGIFTLVDFILMIIFRTSGYIDVSNMYSLNAILLCINLFLLMDVKKVKLGTYLFVFNICSYTVYSTYLLGYNKNAIMLYPIILLVVHTILPRWGKLRIYSTITIFLAFILTLHLRFSTVAKYNDTLGYVEIINLAFALGGASIIIYARQVAEKIVNNYTKQLDKITREANVDFLTGLYNRRFMRDRVLVEDIGEAYLIMSDIDFFKKVNDTYGHNCGDYVLKEIANILINNFRAIDVICRWGGEEFLVFMRNTKGVDIEKKLESIRESIETNTFEYEGQSFNVTMSFGYTLIKSESDVNKYIEYADTALYSAKHTGRNKVVNYESIKNKKQK